MSVVPNYTVGTVPPNGANQGDIWYDTTNGHLNLHNGTNFVQVSMPALGGLITGSQTTAAPAGGGGPMYVPATTVSMGGTWAVPAGYVGMVYDLVHNRMCIVGSGGATFKTVAFA